MSRAAAAILALAVALVTIGLALWWALDRSPPIPPDREPTSIGIASRTVHPTPATSDPPPPPPPSATNAAPPPEEARTQATTHGWADPTNERVLGSKDWMAPDDPEEVARIDRVFEAARAARVDPRLSDASRFASVEAARVAVDACFEALEARNPAARGRLIVAWKAGVDDGRGWLRDPRITVNYGLDDPAFEACVVDGVARQTFRGGDGAPIDVEVPFFYDGAF